MLDGLQELELDLHGLTVEVARRVLTEFLNDCARMRIRCARIIHGKGTGAVRERVHALLKGDRRIARYGLAPANQGGSGATVVEFRS